MCYVVVDLELCKVSKSGRTTEFPWSNEIIQIGAVLLDESYRIVDDFSTFVSPVFGRLDANVELLTGITEEDLRDAPEFAQALEHFLGWMPKEASLVEWSRTEEIQFAHEIQGKKIELEGMEILLGTWTDCQELFDKKIDANRRFGLEEALNISDIDYRPGAHNAGVDAYNTALLFAKLRKNPDFALNPYYERAGKTEPALKSSIGSMFSWLGTLELS